MAKAMRVFLIGYEPPGWDFDTPPESNLPMQRKIRKLMDEADLASIMPDGWPIGEVMDMNGAAYTCTEHEHDGKVVVVKPVARTRIQC